MQTFRPSVTFVILFALLYALFHTLYFLIPDTVLRDLVYRWVINAPAAAAINALTSEHAVSVRGNQLVSPRVVLEVVRGCDGSGVFFIVSAAMLAFQASLTRKIAGIAASLAVVYVLNELRVIVLYFALVHRPTWFMPLHTYFIPTFLIVAICLLFLVWGRWVIAGEGRDAVAA